MKRFVMNRMLASLLRWRPMVNAEDGYTVVVTCPWVMHHLLAVNLRFLTRMRLDHAVQIRVMIDRPRNAQTEAFAREMAAGFPGLPLAFDYYGPVLSALLERIKRPKANCTASWGIALARCRTRWVILQDFDLYPVRAGVFEDLFAEAKRRGLRFVAPEVTRFGGLRASDRVLGTWQLCLDAAWVRERFRLIDIAHVNGRVDGRRVALDHFGVIQLATEARDLAESVSREDYIHVTQLVGSYVDWRNNQRVRVRWRLHYLRYLESLIDEDGPAKSLVPLTEAMASAEDGVLEFGGRLIDFAGEHVTCANVLRRDVTRMEQAMYGRVRPEVARFVEAFEGFLGRYGDARPVRRGAEVQS